MSTVTTNELKRYGLPEDDTVMFEQFLNDTAGYNVEKMDSEITRLDAAIDGKLKLNNENLSNVNFIRNSEGNISKLNVGEQEINISDDMLKNDLNELCDASYNVHEFFKLENKNGSIFIHANINANTTYEISNITGVGIQVFTTSKKSASTEYRIETVTNWQAGINKFTWTATVNAPYLMIFFSGANGSVSVKRLNTVIENIEANIDTIESNIDTIESNIDTRLNGLELTQKLGYIDTGGILRTATTGTNKYVEINNIKQNAVIVYSGNYTNSSWGLVYGYYADGTIVKLLNGKSGGYENQVIIVTDDKIQTIRAWSDSSIKALSCRFYSFKDVLGTFTTMNGEIDKCLKDSHKLIVDVNGGGDFTDINTAITYAKNNFDVVNTPITIYIKNGTYQLSQTSYWPYTAIDIKNNRISLVGESRDGVKLKITNTATLQNRVIDVGGECIVANLSIYCLNDGTYTTSNDLGHNCYGIHNDSDFANDNIYETVLENLYIYSECHAPIGAGLRNNQKQIYRNIETVANGIYGSGFYVHAPAIATDRNCSVVVDNVTAITKNSNKAIDMTNVNGSLEYTAIPTTIRRSIFITNGSTKGYEGFKTSHALTNDSALNNVSDLNY